MFNIQEAPQTAPRPPDRRQLIAYQIQQLKTLG